MGFFINKLRYSTPRPEMSKSSASRHLDRGRPVEEFIGSEGMSYEPPTRNEK
jgi:hypothetical protein